MPFMLLFGIMRQDHLYRWNCPHTKNHGNFRIPRDHFSQKVPRRLRRRVLFSVSVTPWQPKAQFPYSIGHFPFPHRPTAGRPACGRHTRRGGSDKVVFIFRVTEKRGGGISLGRVLQGNTQYATTRRPLRHGSRRPARRRPLGRA